MAGSPRVGSIFVHPIKSLDRVAVQRAVILRGGSLQHDREFALFAEDEKWMNGKRDYRIHEIRAQYDLFQYTVTVTSPRDPSPHTFHLLEQRRELESWFSDSLGRRIRMQRNVENGFPDDLQAWGPTVVSSATLRQVGAWFGNLDLPETGRRFRANIELETDIPFWEDRLYGGPGESVAFRIGPVAFEGVNPCQRCVVPSRDSMTGAAIADFQRTFGAQRAATLPAWVAASRFDHYYRLAVNTRIPASEAGKVIGIGDAVAVEGQNA